MNQVGSVFDVSVEVAAWDAAGADVELSCAAVFSREAADSPLSGGLAHLDAALDGHLVQLRTEGAYTAAVGECLLIAKPSLHVSARAVLLVGMGDPAGWSTLRLRDAVRSAAEFALAMGVRSAAFAPGMLDSGLGADATVGASGHMVEGLAAALHARSRLTDFGLAERPALERWVFDVGAARLPNAIEQFRKVLTGRTG
jgi:hypothetical protein